MVARSDPDDYGKLQVFVMPPQPIAATARARRARTIASRRRVVDRDSAAARPVRARRCRYGNIFSSRSSSRSSTCARCTRRRGRDGGARAEEGDRRLTGTATCATRSARPSRRRSGSAAGRPSRRGRDGDASWGRWRRRRHEHAASRAVRWRACSHRRTRSSAKPSGVNGRRPFGLPDGDRRGP